jgi:uncharacterized protein YcfL
MPIPNDSSLFLRLRCLVVLLLVVLLPVYPASAKNSPEPFGKSLPADGAQEQHTLVLLKWISDSTITNYEYCIDTTDNDACDTIWESTGTTTHASVQLLANTVYYWHVRNTEGLKISYSDGNTWWSFNTGAQAPGSRRPSSMQTTPFTAGENPEKGGKALPLTNLLQDPSFEAYTPNPFWSEADSEFGTPLCNGPDCNYWNEAHPRTGSIWAWFGGIAASTHTASLSQSVIFPSCGNARLQFYFWIGYAQPGSGTNDQFFARIDGTTVFSANASQINSYPGYTLINLNVNQFANGARHTIQFSHVNRGHEVGFNLDDIALIGCPVISGNAGVAGASLNYTGGSTTADVNGNYSFKVPFGWSGTVTPSKASYLFSPTKRMYSNVMADQFGQNYTATQLYSISGNTGIPGVTLSYTDGTPKTVTSQSNGNYSLTVAHGWNGTVTPGHPCFAFNPASRGYNNLAANQTAQNFTPSFNAGSGCADITARIGDVNQGRFGLEPGASTRASFPGVDQGPLKLTSTNGVPLIAAERLIYKVDSVATSFTEMMGLPDSQLDNLYYLPWYNNVGLDTQLRFANVSGATATVHVYIGGVEMEGSPFTLLAGESTRQSFPGIDDGPVKIESDVNIVAAERLIYKANGAPTSFSEMMALPEKQLDSTYHLPWYNNTGLDTQLRFANVSGATATVHVYIGGVEMDGSPFTLLAGESTRQSFPAIDDGPVKIESDQNIVAAERLIYKVGGIPTSFTEMMALPDNQLHTTHWLPWYNNTGLDTQLRIANVSASPATVHVYIGGEEMQGSPFPLLAGESVRKSFPGIDDGPVQIVSDQDIVVAERLIYKVDDIPTSFSEMLALPDPLLHATFWFPWYNNTGLDTQLRFGVP